MSEIQLNTPELPTSKKLMQDGTLTGVVIAALAGGREGLWCLGHDRPADDPDAIPLHPDLLMNVGSVT